MDRSYLTRTCRSCPRELVRYQKEPTTLNHTNTQNVIIHNPQRTREELPEEDEIASALLSSIPTRK
uniref:Uncharacterized protein n=1 Tax=Arundo donax TaxID=35708 RepID=A0A0A9C940_ARUDO